MNSEKWISAKDRLPLFGELVKIRRYNGLVFAGKVVRIRYEYTSELIPALIQVWLDKESGSPKIMDEWQSLSENQKENGWHNVKDKLPQIGQHIQVKYDGCTISGTLSQLKQITTSHKAHHVIGNFDDINACGIPIREWRECEEEKPFRYEKYENKLDPHWHLVLDDRYLDLYGFEEWEVKNLCNWLNRIWLPPRDKLHESEKTDAKKADDTGIADYNVYLDKDRVVTVRGVSTIVVSYNGEREFQDKEGNCLGRFAKGVSFAIIDSQKPRIAPKVESYPAAIKINGKVYHFVKNSDGDMVVSPLSLANWLNFVL